MPTPAPISIQLYSLRAEAATDFRSVLERLGRKGFCGVELAGFNNLEPSEFATIASDNGLRVSSAHVNLAKAPEFEATLDTHLSVGATTMVVPFMPPESFATTGTSARLEVVSARQERETNNRSLKVRIVQMCFG